jgi:uncharacterized membrane protein YphA (DoxX/SURF4 family)
MKDVVLIRIARWILGGVFIYLGVVKALHPVDFLKIIREYGVVEGHIALNLMAVILPWLEVVCGVLLLVGLAVRGTALVVLVLLLSFTGLLFNRAWTMHEVQSIPLCAVRFDCGCGTGEVLICRKLAENALLSMLAIFLLARGEDRGPRAP